MTVRQLRDRLDALIAAGHDGATVEVCDGSTRYGFAVEVDEDAVAVLIDVTADVGDEVAA